MNRKELVEAIISNKELSHLTKKDADQFINTTLDTIKKAVKKGDDVSLVGFGTFTKVKRAARTGVNPATGEKIKIKANIRIRTLPKILITTISKIIFVFFFVSINFAIVGSR